MENNDTVLLLLVSFPLTVYLYKTESCLTILQDIDQSSVRCDNTSDPVSCTVACNEGHMFDDGSTSTVYHCQNNETFSSPVYKHGCIRRLSASLKMKVFVEYRFTELGVYCLDRHTESIMLNKELFRTQLTRICNQFSNRNISLYIYNITSRTSSFSILTAYGLQFETSFLSQNEIELCAELIWSNIKYGALLMYASSLQCLNGPANVSINHYGKPVLIAIVVCPGLYQPNEDKKDMIYCVGVKQLAYVSEYSSSVKLFCEVQLRNFSNGLVYWEHNGGEIEITPKYDGSTVLRPSLIIHNVTHTDSGEYTCNARNEFGSSKGIPISLTVLAGQEKDTSSKIDSTTSQSWSSKSQEKLSTQDNSLLQKVVSDDKESKFVGVSVVAAFGWTLAVVLAIILLYIKRERFIRLPEEKNKTMDYSDLDEFSDVSKYSSIQMKTVASEEYECVENHTEFHIKTDVNIFDR